MKTNFIISADIGGQIIKSTLTETVPEILYHNSTGSGITCVILRDDQIMATSIDNSMIKISLSSKEILKKSFESDLGSINCIASLNSFILMGTDSGKLIVLSKMGRIKFIETRRNSPIISIAANSKRIAIGHFDGSITVFTFKGESFKPLFTEIGTSKGAIWSLAIDEISLISCSLNCEVILRKFL